MEKNYLFAPYCKSIGWSLLLPFAGYYLYYLCNYDLVPEITMQVKVFAIISDDGWFRFINRNILSDISMVGMIVSLLLISFSREKNEDEYIEKIRLYSLIHSLLFGCVVLVLGILLIYNLYFILLAYFSVIGFLLFFVLLFNIRLIRLKRSCPD